MWITSVYFRYLCYNRKDGIYGLYVTNTKNNPMSIFVKTLTSLDSSRASFRTHLNYIKCLKKLFADYTLSVSQTATSTKRDAEITRFKKLYKITLKSIDKDIELSREDSAFGVITAPWFPVKCYYALYYLESILVHLIDGCAYGFTKGGHAGIRKKMYGLVSSCCISFNQNDLNIVHNLTQVQNMPAINPGQNTKNDYWQKNECAQSVAKKLMEYKLHDAKIGRKWNLHTKKDQAERKQFIAKEQLMLIDFFYWYRIKANYRDLDYIDFENGIAFNEILEYLETYYEAFNLYRDGLVRQINLLFKK